VALIHFACPTCKKVLKTPDGFAGAKVCCAGCGQHLRVPSPAKSPTVLGELLPSPSPPKAKQPEMPLWQAAPSPVRNPSIPATRPADYESIAAQDVASGPLPTSPTAGDAHIGDGHDQPISPVYSDPPGYAGTNDLEEVKPTTRMTTFTHTRCYQCGRVIPINAAFRREVTVGANYVSGSLNPSYGHHGLISGGGRQWQRVDFCVSCEKKAKEKERQLSQLLFWVVLCFLVVPLGFVLLLLFGWLAAAASFWSAKPPV
jgi:hypothetical protein